MTVVEKNLEDFQSKLWVWSKFSFGNITQNLVGKKNLKEAKDAAIRGGCGLGSSFKIGVERSFKSRKKIMVAKIKNFLVERWRSEHSVFS